MVGSMNNPCLLGVYSPRLPTLRSSLRSSREQDMRRQSSDKYVDKSNSRPPGKSSDKSNLLGADQIFGLPGEDMRAGMFLRGGGRSSVGEGWGWRRERHEGERIKQRRGRDGERMEEKGDIDWQGGMMRRGRETRSSLREGIWNWGKKKEKQRLRRFSLCERSEKEEGVRVRMSSASEVEFCLDAHQAYAVVGHKERESKRKKARELKPNTSIEDDICDCGKDGSGDGERTVRRSGKSRKSKDIDQRPAEKYIASDDDGQCDCDEEFRKAEEAKYRNRDFCGREEMEDDSVDVCDCSSDGGKDNGRGGQERQYVDDACDCEEEEDEEEDQSEAYRSLPEVQEDFGIVRKIGRDFDKRQEEIRTNKREANRHLSSYDERSIARTDGKSKDKKALADKTNKNSENLVKRGKVRNQRIQNDSASDVKRGNISGQAAPIQEVGVISSGLSIQERVVSGQTSPKQEGVISSGQPPRPIRHFERSGHLCQDVHRLRK